MADANVGEATEYKGRLTKLEGHAIKTEGRLDRIEHTQGDHTRKMDRQGEQLGAILSAVTGMQSAPRFNLHEWARTIGVVVGIFGALAGLSVWLIITLTRTDVTLNETRLQHLTQVTEMRMQFMERMFALQKSHGETKVDKSP